MCSFQFENQVNLRNSQVIHVDRMRKKYPQTLRGEVCDEERSAPENGPESLDIEDSN